MAKNEVKSSSNKNNSSSKNSSSTHKNIFIICAAIVIVLLIALWIFSINGKVPTAPTQPAQGAQATEGQVLQPPTEEEEEVGLAGKAISGFLETLKNQQLNHPTLSPDSAVIDPTSGNVLIDSANNQGIQFTIEISAQGMLPGITESGSFPDCTYRTNEYYITIQYDSNSIKYDDIINDLLSPQIMNIEKVTTAGIVPSGIITFRVTSAGVNDYVCYLSKNKLLELTFTPLVAGLDKNAQIKILSFYFTSTQVSGTKLYLTNLGSSTFTIKKKLYKDADGDSFGDSTTFDGFLSTDTALSYVSKAGDCDDNNAAVYPNAQEVCDGIDNNCANGITDEVVPDICYSQANPTGYTCGVFYVCEDSRVIDCNNPTNDMNDPSSWTSFSTDTEKCGNDMYCKDGQCTAPTQAQDCSQTEPFLTCQTNLNKCNIDLTTAESSLSTCTTNLATCNTNLNNCVVSQDSCIFKSSDFIDFNTALAALTPACGDGTCNKFEHKLTCPQDCTVDCGQYSTYCVGTDTDVDGLTNDYENYLNTNAGKEWFSPTNPDTDGDGIKDNKDYCPGTITSKGDLKFTVASGQIGMNGCYAGDVAIQGVGQRPDNCFTILDTAYLLDYYISPLSTTACTNLFGNTVK